MQSLNFEPSMTVRPGHSFFASATQTSFVAGRFMPARLRPHSAQAGVTSPMCERMQELYSGVPGHLPGQNFFESFMHGLCSERSLLVCAAAASRFCDWHVAMAS